jgi:fermentation-respiration switch protein FrsA (DUF1100 family)
MISCNSFFYYPSRKTFLDISKTNLTYFDKQVRTKDAITLSARMVKPLQLPAKGVIVQFHGNAENMTSHMAFVLWLVDHGYWVVTFDYRGYGQSEGTPEREGLVNDGIAILEFVRQQPELRNLPLFVLGQSLGGAVAVPALALSKPASAATGLILDSTFSSYRGIARDKLSSIWLTWPLQVPLSYLISDEYSPVDYIQELDLPMLFLHGDSDRVIPYRNVEPLYRKAPAGRKEILITKGGDHLHSLVDPQSASAQKFLWFLTQHAPVKAPHK